MNWQEVLTITLLTIGVLGTALTSLGLLFTHDAFDQIQFLAPASLVGAVFIGAAVLVHSGFNQAGAKTILILFLLFWANPILSHATARAARVRHRGRWQPTKEEHIAPAEEEK